MREKRNKKKEIERKKAEEKKGKAISRKQEEWKIC